MWRPRPTAATGAGSRSAAPRRWPRRSLHRWAAGAQSHCGMLDKHARAEVRVDKGRWVLLLTQQPTSLQLLSPCGFTTLLWRLLQCALRRHGMSLKVLFAAQAAADEGPDVGLARADSGSRSDDDNDDDLDMDLDLEFDSDGLPGSGKPAQKRQRRRVVVEPRDPSGRLYTAAEIRRMKRCGALSCSAPSAHVLSSPATCTGVPQRVRMQDMQAQGCTGTDWLRWGPAGASPTASPRGACG